MSEEQRRAYDYYLDTLVRDTDVMKTKILEAEIKGRKEGIEKGRKEGMEKGIEKGRAEGRAEERLENAKSLKENGVPTDLIVKSLKLTEEELQQL